MDYQQWVALFGLPANDPAVVSALATHGVTAPIALRPQEFRTGADLKNEGLTVAFTSDFTLNGGVADLPILASVTMTLVPPKSSKGWVAYNGPLPFGLKKTHSRDELVAALGTPDHLDEDFCSARWSVEGKRVSALFSDDWKRVRQLGLALPKAL